MRSCAVVVVGHVDHGKTSLVRVLTGKDTDRLPEEKVRGVSITLGFAHKAFAAGVVDFIDSPGHEDFIRAMACGASGAQAALVVVSATDGVERQTREHLEILGHLGVRCGVVALAKCDLAPVGERSALQEEITRSLAGSPFAGEPHIFCSATTGEGLDALNGALEALIHRAPPPAPLPGAVLPVDRVFTVKGAGTVATGTLLGGPLHVGDDAEVSPSGASSTIRRLQARGEDVEAAHPGMRAAVNLRGVAADSLRRGNVIAARGAVHASWQVDAWVDIGPGRGALKHGDDIRVLIGTASHVATAFVWGERKAVRGNGAFVRLRFHEAAATYAKQCGILRRLSPAETLGGLVIVDPSPPSGRWRRLARLAVLEAARHGGAAAIALALADQGRGVARRAEILRLAGMGSGEAGDPLSWGFEAIDPEHVAPREAVEAAKAAFVDAVSDSLARRPSLVSLPASDIHRILSDRFARLLLDHAARALLNERELIGDASALALPDRDPFSGLRESRRQKLDWIERVLLDNAMSPPSLSELQGERGRDADLVELLAASGRAVFLRNVSLKQTLLFHSEALKIAYDRLHAAFPPPAEFTMSEARVALETSRKYAIPLLEHFDKVGLTRRSGDVRCVVAREL